MNADNLHSGRPSRGEEFVTRIEARVQALDGMHKDLAIGLAELLTETLGTETQVEVSETMRTTFGEYLKALATPSLSGGAYGG